MPVQVEGDNTPEKQRIAAEIKRGVDLYLTLDLQRVQNACNAKRCELLESLAPYREHELLVSFPGLQNTTAQRARQQLARPFALSDPLQPITINLQYDDCEQVPNAPAAVVIGDPQYASTIFVFAKNIDSVALCARDTRGPLLDAAFHEMLHLTGPLCVGAYIPVQR